MNKNRGYLLLAHGAPFYHKAAFNMAVSLKVRKKNEMTPEDGAPTQYPIALVTDGNWPEGLTPHHRKVFDEIITLKPEHRMPFYAKTRLFEYSPFKQTIFLDCDGLCIRNPDYLFDRAEGFPFLAQKEGEFTRETGHQSNIVWCDIPLVYDYYGLDPEAPFTETNNSFLYFDKSKEARHLFALSEHFYAHEWYPAYTPYGPQRRLNRPPEKGHYPDELAFEVAMAHMGYRIPVRLNPIHFATRQNARGAFSWLQCAKRYPFFGLYGARGYTHSSLWQTYNNSLRIRFARDYSKQTGHQIGNGFKLDESQKAGGTARYKYAGLRTGKRPAQITRLINSYKKKEGVGV